IENDVSSEEQIEHNLPSIANTIKAYTEYTLNAFKQVDNANIDKVTLEFGIKVMGKIGVPYVTTSADSHLKITVDNFSIYSKSSLIVSINFSRKE
ncbi:MAG: CU044_2847 family protein, partial [Crocosphaera sp.]|nr:CU044_2847 family protein [Crocosphaera sp.]